MAKQSLGLEEREKCIEMADVITADQRKVLGTCDVAYDYRLADVFVELRTASVPWVKILSLVGQILAILAEGGAWEEVLKKILDLFAPTIG